MARKPLTKPRKHASQQRSRVTVDALIEATARILVKDGFDKASTNRIAEKAGVSVGSLYQVLSWQRGACRCRRTASRRGTHAGCPQHAG